MLMAGLGSRTKNFGVPKPLIPLNGKPMIEHAIETLNLPGQYIFVTRIYDVLKWYRELQSILIRMKPDAIRYSIDYDTDGPLESALIAENSINNLEPLIITNCDQIMRWDANKFFQHIQNSEDDGIVVTYNSQTEKNSYVKLDENGYALKFKEKEVISNHSLTGIHYWKRGRDFVESAKLSLRTSFRVNGEYFIAPSYNILIQKGMKISTYPVKNDEFFPVGVPEDIDKFLSFSEKTL
jgi:dTDP-glucose pyrophosphorylase